MSQVPSPSPAPVPPLPLYLPFDKTAALASNTVTFEFHQAAFGQEAIVKCDYGPFYKTSTVQPFQMFVQGAGQQLTPMVEGTDFVCAEFDPLLSAHTGFDVYKAILVINTTLSGIYAVSYQAVGGVNNPNISLMYQQSLNPNAAAGAVDFATIDEKPATYPPTAHQHDLKDLFGTDYLVAFLNTLAAVVNKKFTAFNSSGVEAKNAELSAAVTSYVSTLASDQVTTQSNISAHIGNTGFPHAYTKAMIGLGNVQNGGFSPITINGTALPVYASPYTVGQALSSLPAYQPSNHATLTNNPHGDNTSNILNIGNIRNLAMLTTYSTGSYTTTLTPTATEKYLSPYYVNMAIADAQANQLTTYLTGGLTVITDPSVGLLTQAQQANSQATQDLSNASQALTDTNSALTSADATISQAQVANRHFTMVEYNALYAALLQQLLSTDYAAFATGSSVSPDGYYVVPPLLDNLYLWLDVNYSRNTYQNDTNGNSRLMVLTDRSINARQFAANNLATAPLFTQSSDITQGVVGVSVGNVAKFVNGTHMDQISGPAVTLSTGMTMIALVKPSTSDTPFTLLTETSLIPLASMTLQPSPGVALQMQTNTSWQPFLAAPATLAASTSTVLVASVAPDAEQYNWLAGCKTLPSANPTGAVQQQNNVWPTTYTQSSPMTRVGNANPSTLCGAELVHLMIYNRQLSFAEIEAVIAYLALSKSNNQAFVVDTSAQNQF